MSSILFSSLIGKINPSFTLEMTAKAAALRAQGVDVINFGVGEPDFNTPNHIIEAGKQAMDDGFTKYTPGSGMIDLKQALQHKLKEQNNLEYTTEQIIVSNGAKQCLSVACQALFDKGDKVLVFTPYWVSFPEFVKIAGATPVFVNTISDKQYEPDFDDLESKIDSNIKGVIINSPSNPTGGVWSDEAILRLLDLAHENNWFVISDETYEQLVYDRDFTCIENLNKDNVNVLTVMSMSKTYAMTGWRMGYAAGDKNLIKAMTKIQGQTTSCPNAISQRASIAALLGDHRPIDDMKEQFRNRRTVMFDELSALPNVHCSMPGGAFYMFPDFSFYLNKKTKNDKILQDTFDLSDYILDTAKVVTVPGDGFGAKGHLRFSFATNNEVIQKGVSAVREALEQLK